MPLNGSSSGCWSLSGPVDGPRSHKRGWKKSERCLQMMSSDWQLPSMNPPGSACLTNLCLLLLLISSLPRMGHSIGKLRGTRFKLLKLCIEAFIIN